MSCAVSGGAFQGISGPTGTVTLTDMTTGTTVATAQLGAVVQQPGYIISGAPVPGSVQLTADFNKDGKVDILASGVVYLGNGDGTFQSGKPVAGVPNGLFAGTTGDFNGDGIPDLIGGYKNGGFSIYLGNGDGTFQQPIVYPVSGSSGYVPPATGNVWGTQTMDVDGDGYADLLVWGADPGASWLYESYVLRNNRQNGFEVTFALGSEDSPAEGWPLQGNSLTDLIESDFTSGIKVYSSNGDGTFQQPLSYAYSPGVNDYQAHPPAAGYSNNNGVLGLAFFWSASSGQYNSIGSWLGNGDGALQPGPNYELPQPTGNPSSPNPSGDLLAGSFLKGRTRPALSGRQQFGHDLRRERGRHVWSEHIVCASGPHLLHWGYRHLFCRRYRFQRRWPG